MYELAQRPEEAESSSGSAANPGQKIRLFSGPGTRRWPRYEISEVPLITRVSSRSGSKMKLVNISRGGALLQTNQRIAPRTMMRLDFDTAGHVIQFSCVVVRSSVSYSKGSPRYQAAVAFDRLLQILNKSRAAAAETLPVFVTSEQKPVRNDVSEIISQFLAAGFFNGHDPGPDEQAGLNDW
jgi:hypothetical protein